MCACVHVSVYLCVCYMLWQRAKPIQLYINIVQSAPSGAGVGQCSVLSQAQVNQSRVYVVISVCASTQRCFLQGTGTVADRTTNKYKQEINLSLSRLN